MRKLVDLPSGGPVSSNSAAVVGANSIHDSAAKHVSGRALYLDDIPGTEGTLHAACGKSSLAHARIVGMDLSAVRGHPGVVAVIAANDVPGKLDVGPVFPGDPLFALDTVEFVGQPIFAVAATSLEAARQAARLAKIDYEPLPPILDIDTALTQKSFVRPMHSQVRGDVGAALRDAPYCLQGKQRVGGQEHFYLEGQACIASPTEDGGVFVQISSQHPSEVQKLVAQVLALPIGEVQVEVRRMGGAFGGKETQAAPLACLAAVLARVTGRPVKYRMARADDMVMTGKRHDFHNRYHVGFDERGQLRGADIELAARCGYSPDLSDAVVDRAMFHADNAYFLDQARILGHRCKTNTVSNTAFRGFGGPQGMMIIEQAMDDIARYLGKDPLDVRKANLYREGRDTTHYGQKIEQHTLPRLIEQLETSSGYWQRRDEIRAFNKTHSFLKKGLALTPVKYGISYTVKHLNQAGALVHIYTDGSIHLNHGGTEMGQGLFVKIAQIVAEAFQLNLDWVKVSATRTDKVPNTSPTAASAGSDLNGMAALNACNELRGRLVDFICAEHQVRPEQVTFRNERVEFGARSMSWPELIQAAYLARVSLSATGHYATPRIFYDRSTGTGHPFFYYVYGAACSEVLVDCLTGEHRVLRVDILHDVGSSLNPAIDIGQVEGGFIQGMGWLTTEELVWDEQGKLLSNSPANYKIPTAGDTPPDFRVQLLANQPNHETTIFRSKAVGEPPFMLAISVWSALRDAIASLTGYQYSPPLDTPATPERVFWAIEAATEHQREAERATY